MASDELHVSMSNKHRNTHYTRKTLKDIPEDWPGARVVHLRGGFVRIEGNHDATTVNITTGQTPDTMIQAHQITGNLNFN